MRFVACRLATGSRCRGPPASAALGPTIVVGLSEASTKDIEGQSPPAADDVATRHGHSASDEGVSVDGEFGDGPGVGLRRVAHGLLGTTDESNLPVPAVAGRYVLLDKRADATNSTPSRAYDVRLRREVALKFVAVAGDARGGVRDEAMLLAKLTHQHVTRVYDVIEVGERAVIATEIVRGPSLDEWLLVDGKRSWREILCKFVAAGRGLAALHGHGVVHGAFSTCCVTVTDSGRVVLGGFECARAIDDKGVESASRRAAASTDQLDYCLALSAALSGDDAPDLVSEIRRGRSIPRTLKAIVKRGHSADPTLRWPNMESLIVALSRELERKRRSFIKAGVAVGALLLPLALWQWEASLASCQPDARLVGVWDVGVRETLTNTFRSSTSPVHLAALPRVLAGLDTYVDRWTQVYGAACDVGAGESGLAGQLDQSMSCLTARLTALRVARDVLEEADPHGLDRALELVGALPRPESCVDPIYLAADVRPPESETLRTAVAEQREQLARVDALRTAGRYADGTQLAEDIVSSAEALGYTPLLAEAALARARLGVYSSEVVAAAEHARTAYQLAASSNQRLVASEAASVLTFIHAALDPDRAAAWRWCRHARAALGPDGGPDTARELVVTRCATALLYAGDHEAARAMFVEAHQLAVATYGESHDRVAAILGGLAVTHRKLDDLEGSLRYAAHGLDVTESLYGPRHPTTARAVLGLGGRLVRAGRGAELVDRIAVSVRVLDTVRPSNSVEAGNHRALLATALREAGDDERAREEYQVALGILDQLSEQDDSNLAGVRVQLALLDMAQATPTPLGPRWKP